MEKTQKIVLILGNGFDLDLGLKTSYKDYYDSGFCPRDYPAPIINYLNKRLSSSKENIRWYDLENQLYDYAKAGSSLNPRKDIITEKERDFIRKVQFENLPFGVFPNKDSQSADSLLKKQILRIDLKDGHFSIPYRDDLSKSFVERDKIALDLIKKTLCRYLQQLSKPEPENYNNTVAFRVLEILKCAVNNNNILEIFTFNFTRLQAICYIPQEISVNYMHGNCEEGKVIVGTRDDLEIESDYVFLQKAFDPTFNPPHIVSSLQDADEVVIFGHSIGENDRQYFKSFFKQQTDYSHVRRKSITIFTKDSVSEVEIRKALQNMTDGNLSTLCSQNSIPIIKTGNLKEDQQKLRNFFINHGVSDLCCRSIIGPLLRTTDKD